MAITICRARKILGEKATKMTDEEITQLITFLTRLSDIAIDSVLAKTSEQKRRLMYRVNQCDGNYPDKR